MSELQWFPVAIAGGLQDSKPIPSPDDAELLQHFALFRGRFALRAPLEQKANLVDDQGTPANVTHVLAVQYHVGKCYAVGYSAGQTDAYLYRLETDGSAEAADPEFPNASPIAVVWSSAATVPRVTLTSFEGGSATAGVQRFYIADATGTYVSRYWNSTGSAMVDVEEDFNDDGTKEDISFRLIFSYNDHMFGTDFLQSGEIIDGLLRFSQPGLIPADEPGVVNNASREWWNSDRRQIGSRGEKIVCVGEASGAKILFKRRETYALFGYDAASFQLRRVSLRVGAVGPHAAAALPDGRCVFWSEKGPHITDGQTAVDIGEQIRKRVNQATFTEDFCVEYSPDEGLVYCVISMDGSAPSERLCWDDKTERWLNEGDWKATGGGTLRLNDMKAIPREVLSGPAAAPSSVVADTASDIQLDLSWTNGDTAIDVVTDIHRSTSSGFVPGAGNLINTVLSGVSTYINSDLAAETTYFYKLIHRRNGQSSTASLEASGETAVARPTALITSSLSNGIKVRVTNNSSSTDVVIERKLVGGNFSILTTLAAQSTGQKTYDDTTASCGQAYTYRVKAAKATFTDSPYTNEETFTACQTAPIIVADSVRHSVSLLVDCPAETNVLVVWKMTTVKASDTAKIYQNSDGAGFVLRATVSAQEQSYHDIWPKRSGVSSQTLQYRVEVYDNSVILADTADSLQSNELVDVIDCPE